jgi:hypothetical protein
MSVHFKIFDANANEVEFDTDEACDTGQVKPMYGVEMSQEKSAGGQIKQQIRQGIRFIKTYEMNLPESVYINFINLITNGANDYYIQYTTAPTVLSNNSSISTTNNFKIALDIGEVKNTVGSTLIYSFDLTIASVTLF